MFFSLLLDTGVVPFLGLWRTVRLRALLYLSSGEHVCVSVGAVRVGGLAGSPGTRASSALGATAQ